MVRPERLCGHLEDGNRLSPLWRKPFKISCAPNGRYPHMRIVKADPARR
jgi:hypothetical protein